MVTESRPTNSVVVCNDVRKDLEQHPGAFDFFQAVRLLQQWSAQAGTARFRANPSLAFPASQIDSLEFAEDGQAQVNVNFFGLVGPVGVLPYFYSELVNDRIRAKDSSLQAFLDIFHHHFLTLFYEAWQKHRFPVSWEAGKADGVSSALMAVLGIRSAGFENRQNIPDRTLLFYAGLLSLQSRPGATLEQLLTDYFQVPVAVEQFRGGWYLLPQDQQCRLGSEGFSEQLGMGTLLGDAVWNQQSRVRVRIGPMPLCSYRGFLPGGDAHRDIEALKDFFSNRQYDFELQLVLERDQVPEFELGAELPLGWCLWLKTEEFRHHPDDAILPLGQQLCI